MQYLLFNQSKIIQISLNVLLIDKYYIFRSYEYYWNLLIFYFNLWRFCVT